MNFTDDTDASSASRLIPFSSAEIADGPMDAKYLIVRGTVGCINMNIRLVPVVYVSCPEYWRIEVEGSLFGGVCLKAMKDYTEVIPLAGITGSKGIEVVGVGKPARLDLEGGCKT